MQYGHVLCKVSGNLSGYSFRIVALVAQLDNELGEEAGCVTITRQTDGNGNTSHLRLDFGGSVTVTSQIIRVTTTPCYYGGVRYWLLCPAVKDGVLCENRVGAEYPP